MFTPDFFFMIKLSHIVIQFCIVYNNCIMKEMVLSVLFLRSQNLFGLLLITDGTE
jgi:hypothetical protein